MIMNKQTRTEIIPKIQNYLATQPVERAWLFGSYSRGEEREDSDIDILISVDSSAHVGLFKLSGMLLDMEDRLNRKVDLVTDNGLMDFARPSVERDKILIYERTE